MKLIIGLGNPGEKYLKTRHNLGFLFLDFLSFEFGFTFKEENKFLSEVGFSEYKTEKIIFAKPQTFMNLSGNAVSKIANFYKIDKKDIIVIFDDVSMEFGKIRFRKEGSAGGHNGIKDMIKFFGQDFSRIKIGIGNDEKYDLSDFVLGKFLNAELEKLEKEIFPNAKKVLDDFLDLKL